MAFGKRLWSFFGEPIVCNAIDCATETAAPFLFKEAFEVALQQFERIASNSSNTNFRTTLLLSVGYLHNPKLPEHQTTTTVFSKAASFQQDIPWFCAPSRSRDISPSGTKGLASTCVVIRQRCRPSLFGSHWYRTCVRRYRKIPRQRCGPSSIRQSIAQVWLLV